MLDEWKEKLPSCSGFWWLELPPPIVVYVLVYNEDDCPGEFRHTAEEKWRFLEDFRDHRRAGPLVEPFEPVCMKPPPKPGPGIKPKRSTRKQLHGNALLAEKEKRGYRCEVCGWRPPLGHESMVELHHILPVSKGGTAETRNLVLLCPNHHKLAHRVSAVTGYAFRTSEDLIDAIRAVETPSVECRESRGTVLTPCEHRGCVRQKSHRANNGENGGIL